MKGEHKPQPAGNVPGDPEHWHELFEHAPLSLWVEDYSGIQRYLDDLRAQGVTDLREYLAEHPEDVRECMHRIVVLDVNSKTIELFGAKSKEELIANKEKIFRDGMEAHFTNEMVDIWNGVTWYEREGVNYSLNGNPIDIQLWWRALPGHEQSLDRVMVSLSDITVRKRTENYLRYLGTHDVLTGLFNRAHFEIELERLEKEGPFPVSILIADLNDLKHVNDSLGHEEGDNLLRRTTEVFEHTFTPQDVAARMGGDEFAVLLPGLKAADCDRLLARIRKVITMNNTYYQGSPLQLALGIATGEKGQPLEDVRRLADDRMYMEKREFHRQVPKKSR